MTVFAEEPLCCAVILSAEPRKRTTVNTTAFDLQSGAVLLMLLAEQRVHLALSANGEATAQVVPLCSVPVREGGVVGVVSDGDLPVLQDFSICVKCSGHYVRDLREHFMARSSHIEEAAESLEEVVFRSKQLALI